MPKKQKLDFMFPKLHPQHSPTSGAFYSSGRKDKVLVCSGEVSETLTAGLLHGSLFPHLSLVRKVKDIFLHQPQHLSKHVVDEMAEITATSWGVTQEPPSTSYLIRIPMQWMLFSNPLISSHKYLLGAIYFSWRAIILISKNDHDKLIQNWWFF